MHCISKHPLLLKFISGWLHALHSHQDVRNIKNQKPLASIKIPFKVKSYRQSPDFISVKFLLTKRFYQFLKFNVTDSHRHNLKNSENLIFFNKLYMYLFDIHIYIFFHSFQDLKRIINTCNLVILYVHQHIHQ